MTKQSVHHGGDHHLTVSTAAAPSSPAGPHPILLRIARLRAWLFLILLIAFFETWARIAYNVSFIFNPYNIQSITVFATVPQ